MTNYWNSHENIRKKQNSWSSIIGSVQQHGAQIGLGEIDIRSISDHHHHDDKF